MEIIFSNIYLLIIFGLGLFGVLLIMFIVINIIGRENINNRLQKYLDTPIDEEINIKILNSSRLNNIRYQLNSIFKIFKSDKIQQKITSANWKITVSEYQVIRIISSILTFALGVLILNSYFGASALTIIVFTIPGYLLTRAMIKRQKSFQDQLLDTITLIKGTISSGASFLQAMNVVIDEMSDPTSEEFRRVRRETELGISLDQALKNLADRMESDDLNLVVNTISINIQIGGNLSIILGTVIETIRNRIFLAQEIRALTSYAHYVSYLLTLLPFFTGFILALISPTYFENILKPGLTRYVLIYAIISIIIGNIVLRKVSKIEL